MRWPPRIDTYPALFCTTKTTGAPVVPLSAISWAVASDSPVAGQRWFYLRTPWGLHPEMTSCSADGFYAGLPGAGVAPPADSWD